MSLPTIKRHEENKSKIVQESSSSMQQADYQFYRLTSWMQEIDSFIGKGKQFDEPSAAK